MGGCRMKVTSSIRWIRLFRKKNMNENDPAPSERNDGGLR
jgi:hypothetical protein